MARRRFKELHDHEWFPDIWRRGMTDFLSFFATYFFQYEPIFGLIEGLIRKSGQHKLKDYCSGGSGYLLSLLRYLRKHGIFNSEIELTDKYPNLNSFEFISKYSGGAINYNDSSVDVLNPPSETSEIRMIFSAMHHFSPEELKSILKRANKDNCAIGLFDYSGWDIVRAIPLLILLIPHIFIFMPFTKPFSWKKIFWTYIIPAIPLAIIIDAAISRWNGYSTWELKEIIDKLPNKTYDWETGSKPNFLWTGKVVYLTGCPNCVKIGNNL